MVSWASGWACLFFLGLTSSFAQEVLLLIHVTCKARWSGCPGLSSAMSQTLFSLSFSPCLVGQHKVRHVSPCGRVAAPAVHCRREAPLPLHSESPQARPRGTYLSLRGWKSSGSATDGLQFGLEGHYYESAHTQSCDRLFCDKWQLLSNTGPE